MTRRRYTPELLDRVFKPGAGSTPEDRARNSEQMFVRGLDQLTFDDSPKATGRRLTAAEALAAYGFDILSEVASEGSALICESVDAAGQALRQRREQLELGVRSVANATGLSVEEIKALEASRRLPIRQYERVARVLGLDERMLSFRADAGGNDSVAVRLRQLQSNKTAFTGAVVVALSEAAWVAMTQARLEAVLQLDQPKHTFEHEPFFGVSGYPAYRVGYELANSFRERIGVSEHQPILSMRDLVERELGIPVIQTSLGTQVAGATIDADGRRAIVINLAGQNMNVFVRRATLAHEICHLLFDPRQHLQSLRVDEYSDLERRADQVTDRVEQRANAFAAQLLAPQAALKDMYEQTDIKDDLLGTAIDEFGVSFSLARYQLWNALDRSIPLDSIHTSKYRPEPDWEGREAYTTTFHPIHSLSEHPSRAGRFSAVVLRAAEQGAISWDTGAEWLFCSETQLRAAAPGIRDLYPDLFPPPA